MLPQRCESISSLRKQYKTDGLGDADMLVRADLDMRDLYRNECLTLLQDMDDELDYLAKEVAKEKKGEGGVDGADLEAARAKALAALDRYLARVPPAVLADAAARVESETAADPRERLHDCNREIESVCDRLGAA